MLGRLAGLGETLGFYCHVVNQTMNIVDDVRDDDRPTSEYGIIAIES